MEYKSPVYQVISVPIDKVKANTYNPNKVAPPEMRLLYESIRESCWITRISMSGRAACFPSPS